MTARELPQWQACFDDLAALTQRLTEMAPPGAAPDLAVKMLGCVSGAYLAHLWADPDHPDFLPSAGFHHMYGSPNPDTVYRSAAVDGSGRYLLRGHRGTVPEVSIMPFGKPTAGGLRTFPAYDFADLTLGADDTFEVVLSDKPPPDATNWWRLDPAVTTLMLRTVSDEWGMHTEPRVAITRTDADPRRTKADPAALGARLRSFAAVVEAMIMSGITRVTDLRSRGVVNQLVTVDYAANGGLFDQSYQEGWFELDDGQVLLIEAAISPDIRSWSLALTDACFSTLDWANAHSSLNRKQSRPDADGVLRVVIAADDPGVANWLDTLGHRSGTIQCRWSGGRPDVTVTTMRAADVDGALPAGTARVTPRERQQAIRARQVGVQLRSQW